MYDSFSQAYDHFVNWPSRLNYEMPFIETLLDRLEIPALQPRRILDAACGTGWHAIALAQRGWQVSGADYAHGMVKQAQHNARQAHTEAAFIQAGFGELSTRLKSIHQSNQRPTFDAVLCLGNSLPHILDATGVQAALTDFAACLAPGGLLLIQNRNFDLVMQTRQRWMEPQSQRSDDAEWLFLRFYDFLPAELIDFHILSLHRKNDSAWQQQVHTTQLRPILQFELAAQLKTAGFGQIEFYGDMQGAAFDPKRSDNLIAAARLRP